MKQGPPYAELARGSCKTPSTCSIWVTELSVDYESLWTLSIKSEDASAEQEGEARPQRTLHVQGSYLGDREDIPSGSLAVSTRLYLPGGMDFEKEDETQPLSRGDTGPSITIPPFISSAASLVTGKEASETSTFRPPLCEEIILNKGGVHELRYDDSRGTQIALFRNQQAVLERRLKVAIGNYTADRAAAVEACRNMTSHHQQNHFDAKDLELKKKLVGISVSFTGVPYIEASRLLSDGSVSDPALIGPEFWANLQDVGTLVTLVVAMVFLAYPLRLTKVSTEEKLALKKALELLQSERRVYMPAQSKTLDPSL